MVQPEVAVEPAPKKNKALQNTVVWVRGDGGVGKSTLMERFGEVISLDKMAVRYIDEVGTDSQFGWHWEYGANTYDNDGNVIGNLQIGLFWQRLVEAKLSDSFVNTLVDRLDCSKDFIVEGWLPLEAEVQFLYKLRREGVRVWVMNRVV